MPGAHAHTRRRSPEKTIERTITRDLRALGFRAVQFSQARASKQTAGIPDRLFLHAAWGVAVWVEVKAPKGRVSEAQARMHDDLRACGHAVVVARCTADVLPVIRALGAPLS